MKIPAIAIAIAGAVIMPIAASELLANCLIDQDGRVICGMGQCERDSYGKVYCAQPGGGAMRDRYGRVNCGTGYCARNREGEVWCSRIQGGGAALDSYGEVKCLGGCKPGSIRQCEVGR